MSRELLQVLAQRPGCTGSGMYLQSLYRAAHRNSYDQAVVAAANKNNKFQDLGYLKREDFYPVLFESEKLPCSVFGMSDVMPYESSRYCDMNREQQQSWEAAFRTKILEARQSLVRPVVIAHHLWLLTALTAEEFTELPVLGICHGTGLRQLKQNPRFASRVKQGVSLLERIFALNDFQKEEVRRLFEYPAEKITVTGLGYNEENFYFPTETELGERLEKRQPEIIYVGKLSLSKGVSSLLRACDQISERDFKVTLVGSGQGQEKIQIKELAKRVSCPVKFTGQLEQEEVGRLLRHADIFCLPSYYEGFALVLLEALASGLRVVSSDLPGVKNWLPEIARQSPAVEFVELPELKNVDQPVPAQRPGYEAELAAALEKQLQQREELDFLQDENYRTAVKSLSWSGVFHRLESHFPEI